MKIELGEYEKLAMVASAIRNSMESYSKKLQKSSCDKHGMGFNLDRRFSSFETTLSIDSWTGYYGDSNCGRAIKIGDSETFRKLLEAYLNKNFNAIMTAVADDAEKKAIASKTKALASLEEARKKIEAFGSTPKDGSA